MPVPVITVASIMLCPHNASVLATSSQADLIIDGAAALLVSDTIVVKDCPFVLDDGTPSPCVNVTWVNSASSLLVNGDPVLLQTSIGTCNSALGVVQGVVNILTASTSVMAD